MMRLGQGASFFCYFTIVFFIRSPAVVYFLIFIIGLLSCWRLSLAFIYGQEIVEETKQAIAGSLFNLFDAQVLIISSVFYMCLSKQWVNLHGLFVLFTLYSYLVFCFIPESPKFLL